MKVHVFTFDGEEVYMLASIEVEPNQLSISHPAGIFYVLDDQLDVLHGFNQWFVTRLCDTNLFIAHHPTGNVLLRQIEELTFCKASDIEALAYNTGIAEAVKRLSYLKVMKDMFLNTGIKGLLSFLVEKVNRASISGWTPVFGDTDDE